jgi:ethanolamine transporter EutH
MAVSARKPLPVMVTVSPPWYMGLSVEIVAVETGVLAAVATGMTSDTNIASTTIRNNSFFIWLISFFLSFIVLSFIVLQSLQLVNNIYCHGFLVFTSSTSSFAT